MPTDRKSLALIPDDLKFYKHQIEGVRRMCRMAGALLADDMGLGKTATALTVAACAFEEGTAARVLVVCPASLKGNWADEIADKTRFTATVLSSDLSKEKRSKALVDFDADILIVNYEQVISHLDELRAMRFDMAIFDEAHYLKGNKSKRTKAAFKLGVTRNFLLTGSPLLNQVNDLWALLHLIDPKEWPNYWVFHSRHCLMGGYMDKQIVGIKNEAELREKLNRYMLQRFKKDCLDLPDKQFIQVKLDLHPEQKKLYDQAVDEMQIDLPDDAPPMEINNHLVRLLRLKQICGTTATIEGHPDHLTKLDHAMELITETIDNGEPIVVFTQFRGVLAALNERVSAAGIPIWQLHGDVKADARKPIVDAWTKNATNDAPGVLACMFQVGGVGLTMTAASRVILLDKLWAPKLNEQAVDRLHRIGQKSVVQVYELIARNTVESRIERILKQKSAIADALKVDNSDWKKKLIAAIAEQEDES